MNNIILYVGLFTLILILAYMQISNKFKEGFTSLLSNPINTTAGLSNNSMNPWVIDRPTKLIITDIIRKILNMINEQTGMSYYFTAYDQLKQDKCGDCKVRYTADFFVHEMRNLFTRRMLIIFVVDFNNKSVDVEYVNLSNAFKLPTKDFMDYPSSELILQDENVKKYGFHIMGINKSKIDFSVLKSTLPKDVPTPTEFQNWILPMGIASAYSNPQAMFPSRRQSNCWDTHGVNCIEPQTNLLMGVKNSPMSRYPYPYFNPTVNLQKEWGTEYKWLFDLNDNRSGISRQVAGSP
jgi:hypothetical protein